MNETPVLLVESLDEETALLTLNRPERRNALTIELMEALCAALDSLAAEPQRRGITGRSLTLKILSLGADTQIMDDRLSHSPLDQHIQAAADGSSFAHHARSRATRRCRPVSMSKT